MAKDSGSFAALEKRTMKQDRELKPFGRLVEALNPRLREVVIIGGWAHRLYRLDARSQKPTYPPLTTLDSDIEVSAKVAVRVVSIRDRLLAAGFGKNSSATTGLPQHNIICTRTRDSMWSFSRL